MKGTPRSAQFDDIYFSADDGLEETNYVFLKGNNLPESWAGKNSFTIAETGFGTGLNFLSSWKLFEETADDCQTLDFISVEKYPLTPAEIMEALAPWAKYFGSRINQMLEIYPIRVAGFHRVKINSQITLTLIFDDIKMALPGVDAVVDSWFLDGFTPAKNPDMWSDDVFQEMARLSQRGATYATFTAAGDVRRGLIAAGFSVEKQRGFGSKRDMIAGVYDGEEKRQKKSFKPNSRIAIIGGGLAGTSCAYVLKQYGFEPVIYEASECLASGASGNSIGLYNPRFSKLRDSLSDFFAPAYAQFIRNAKQAGDAVDYRPCGSLHLMNDADKEARLRSMAAHWLWHGDHVQILEADEASAIAGIKLDEAALYLPDSGFVSPQKLCDFYARDIEVHLNTKIDDVSSLDAEAIDAKAIILASGAAIKDFEMLSWLPIETIRGQVSLLQETKASRNLKSNLCYGGYLSPSKNGIHVAGSTFEKWTKHTDVTTENHDDNIYKLKNNVAALADENFEIQSGRAGMRVATNDRFPVVGAVPNHNNIYVSSAFGSHGLVGSITAAHLIADLLRGGVCSLSADTVSALSAYRFIERAAKKGRVLI